MYKREWLKAVEGFFRAKNRAWLSGDVEMLLPYLSGTPTDCHSWQEVRALQEAKVHREGVRYRKAKTRLHLVGANWHPEREQVLVEATEHVRFYYEQREELQHEERVVLHRLTLMPVGGAWRVVQDETSRESKGSLGEPIEEASVALASVQEDVLEELGAKRDVRGRYDRVRAYRYSEIWWNGFNPAFQTMKGNDCTNFISQVLYAGGMPFVGGGSRASGWWYRGSSRPHAWSYSWTVAHSLRLALPRALKAQERGDPRELKIGDVICYDWDGDGRWQHNTVVVDFDGAGQPLVDAHTVASHRRFWTYQDSYAWTPQTQYSFFHIPDQF